MKLKLIAAFAIGYVLGTRAGRGRYDQIRRVANDVQSDPRVRDAAKAAEDLARQAAEKVQHDERIADAVSTVRDSAEKLRDQATDVVTGARRSAAPEPGHHRAEPHDDVDRTWPPHPDEHVEVAEDQVVYSAGPDLDTDIESDIAPEPVDGEPRNNAI